MLEGVDFTFGAVGVVFSAVYKLLWPGTSLWVISAMAFVITFTACYFK
jgi:hypothetical protein